MYISVDTVESKLSIIGFLNHIFGELVKFPPYVLLRLDNLHPQLQPHHPSILYVYRYRCWEIQEGFFRNQNPEIVFHIYRRVMNVLDGPTESGGIVDLDDLNA